MTDELIETYFKKKEEFETIEYMLSTKARNIIRAVANQLTPLVIDDVEIDFDDCFASIFHNRFDFCLLALIDLVWMMMP